jgi:membrane protease YdiL (CAAX protease family)
MRPALWILPVLLAVGAGSYTGWLPERCGTFAFWVLAVGPTVVLALALSPRVAREELKIWVTPKWGDFTAAFVGALVLFGLAVLFTKLAMPPGSPRRIWLVSVYSQLGDPKSLQSHAVLVGAGVAVAAAAEELLWRGCVTELLTARLGSRRAWIAAAVLYACAHVPAMWALRADAGLDPLLPLAALGGGLVWGAMARIYGRLVPGILSHALFDWCVVMMFPLWEPAAT